MRRAAIIGLAVVMVGGAVLAVVLHGRNGPGEPGGVQPAAPAEKAGDLSKPPSEQREDYFAPRRPIAPLEPLPPPDTRLTDIYPGLKRLADTGDVRAACRLAFELGRCRNLGAMKMIVEGYTAGVTRATSAGPEVDNSAGAQQRQDYEQAARVCADFPREEANKAGMYNRGVACE